MKISKGIWISRPGISAKKNEDIARLTDRSAWVIDGATGLNNVNIIDSESDASWFVEQWDQYLHASILEKREISNIVRDGIGQITEMFYKEAGSNTVNPIDICSASIALVRWDLERLEYFMLGDCTLIIKSPKGAVETIKDKTLEAFDNKAVTFIKETMETKGLTFAEARCEANEILKKHRLLKNKEQGYWPLEQDEKAVEHGILGSLECKNGLELLLLSDGFAALIDNYHYTDSNEIFSLIEQNGLDGIYKKLREIEASDSECVKYPRLKISDDATAVYIRF